MTRSSEAQPSIDNDSYLLDNENHCQLKQPAMHTPAPPQAPRTDDTPPERPRLSSEEILRGRLAAEIEHGDQRYILRVTRENKLILTK